MGERERVEQVEGRMGSQDAGLPADWSGLGIKTSPLGCWHRALRT